jgi:D-alanyl-D-alanine carboxypeptidase (penicillin-binding protein 5/6)
MSRLFSLLLTFVILFAGAPAASAQTATKKKKKTTQTSAVATPRPKKKEPVEAFPVEEVGGIPKIRSASAIVVDARTGRVLHEVNADQPRPVASTQKLLTGLLIAESGNLNQDIVVEPSDTWAEPSKLYIKPGERYSRQQFLQILLVKSMNDVARALARDNAGSVEAFAARMNAKAQELGMTNSHFVNPNGLPAPGQFSTARDMAQVALAAYHNRTIRNIVNQKTLSFRYADGRVTEFKNTNRVLRNYALCNGMKTGYTDAAGFCLISSGSSGGRDVVTVVLGGKRDMIWTDSYRLLAWGLTP